MVTGSARDLARRRRSRDQTNGLWPCSSFHGWKWSEIHSRVEAGLLGGTGPARRARRASAPRRTGSSRSSPPARTHVRRMQPRALGTRTPDEHRARRDLGLALPAWRGVFYPRGCRSGASSSTRPRGCVRRDQRLVLLAAAAGVVPPVVRRDAGRLRVRGQGRPVHHAHEEAARRRRRRWRTSSPPGVLALGDKLGPVLWQLPPSARLRRGDRIDEFFDLLPRTTGAAAAARRATRRRGSTDRALLDDRRRPAAAARAGGAARASRPGVRRAAARARRRARASPTPPASGPASTTSPPTSSTSGCTATASSTSAATRRGARRVGRQSSRWPGAGRGPRRLRLLRQRREGARAVRRDRARRAAVVTVSPPTGGLVDLVVVLREVALHAFNVPVGEVDATAGPA